MCVCALEQGPGRDISDATSFQNSPSPTRGFQSSLQREEPRLLKSGTFCEQTRKLLSGIHVWVPQRAPVQFWLPGHGLLRRTEPDRTLRSCPRVRSLSAFQTRPPVATSAARPQQHCCRWLSAVPPTRMSITDVLVILIPEVLGEVLGDQYDLQDTLTFRNIA